MRHGVFGPVRDSAPSRRQGRRAAICRVALGAIALALTWSCQPDGSLIQNRLTGALAITVNGLPEGVVAAVEVTGTNGFRRIVTQSETLTDLPIGNYGIVASQVSAMGDRYGPIAASQSITLTARAVTSATVRYAAATGRIQLTVTGVPPGAHAAIQIGGPGGYAHTATTTELITGLEPGDYTLSTGAISTGGTSYLAAPENQPVTVSAGLTAQAGVIYIASSGSLTVAITGLPPGTAGSVSVSGPNGFTEVLADSRTLTGLVPGAYQIAAAVVNAGGLIYSAAVPVQSATVTTGNAASVQVNYAAGAGGATLDLRIDAVYLTQATQRYDGSVPLVAGREAYLRTFVLANQGNAAQPPVRVRLYDGANLIQTYLVPPPGVGVPTSATEGVLTSSWNVLVPGALIQPGLRVLVEVDPNNTVPETNKGNNQFPMTGLPAAVDVRALPVFGVTLVPVLQQANGLIGNLTSGNLQSFLTDLKQMLPVGAIDADGHPVYTTTGPALQSGNGNSAWNTLLSELLALRIADASARYYYGVVKTGYTSGVAGMGFVGGTGRTAVGWDWFPSASNVMAHEVGHNMGRQHAPCGSVAGPDPAFPYPGGSIGTWGLQLNGLVLKPPTTADLMGYCQPSWISDYNWSAMIEYRQSGPNGTSTAGGDGLMVWGRITADSVVLEPAFQVPVAGAGAPTPGTNQLELLGSDGAVLRTIRFEAVEVGDLPGGPERHFGFVVPGPGLREVAGIRVRAGNRVATRVALGDGDPEVGLSRLDDDRIQVRWNAARYPMVLVRDASSGQILSFARGGNATIWGRTAEVDLQFSNGTRTIHRRERILR